MRPNPKGKRTGFNVLTGLASAPDNRVCPASCLPALSIFSELLLPTKLTILYDQL